MPHVLVAEDDAVLARMYIKALQIEGIDSEVASNGEEAVQMIRANPPRLVLLDIMMPKMSGFQVLDIIRSEETTKQMPVVVLTNLHSSDDTNLALAKGANECIVKTESNPMQVVAIAKGYLAKEV